MNSYRRILVISDLHMTGGRNAATGTWSPTEDFFQDDEFARFLRHYSDKGTTTLVINGDLFDFLQVLEFPDQWQEDRRNGIKRPGDYTYKGSSNWQGGTFSYSIPLADINARYGLRSTERATRFLAGRIVEGHELFFRALADFVLHEGNNVVILKGNHDVQLFWPGVQNELLDRILVLAPTLSIETLRERITFNPWFYYEPGLVWIEHGNQYEYTTSFVNFLDPVLPAPLDTSAPPPADANERHVELDLSSFLVRYLTNRVEPVDPLADNIRPLSDYWSGLWRRHPLLVLGTVRAALVFILKAFAKAARLRVQTGWGGRTTSKENERAMKDEADRWKVPFDFLKALDNAKAEPTMAHGPVPVLWWFAKPALTGLLWLLPLLVVAANVSRLPHIISSPNWLAETVHTGMQGAIILATGTLLIGLRQYLRRVRQSLQRLRSRAGRTNAADSPDTPPALTGTPPSDMRSMARWIARTLDVRYVTFGHTHYADVHGLGDDRWYFNTGTWMTILEPREQLHRDARQLTFLEITSTPSEELATGPTSSAQLLCWYPPQSAPRPVVVVDMEERDDDVENGIVTGALSRLGGLTGQGR